MITMWKRYHFSCPALTSRGFLGLLGFCWRKRLQLRAASAVSKIIPKSVGQPFNGETASHDAVIGRKGGQALTLRGFTARGA